MGGKPLKRIKNLSDVTFFILSSVPFTLITIGNITIKLIVVLLRGVSAGKTRIISSLRQRIHTFPTHTPNTLVYTSKAPIKKKHKFKTVVKRRLRSLTKKTSKVLHRPINLPFLPQFRLPAFSKPSIHIPKSVTWFVAGVLCTIFFVFLPYQAYQFLHALPNPMLLTSRPIPVTSKIFDRHGKLLFELYADQNRTPVSLDKIPLMVKQATIAIEDREFYQHIGFSPRGIARAARETLINNHLQGGSTITQQLIKNALLTNEPTISRKVKELLLSFWAERLYTKDQILEMYFNQVPYGGIYWGIESASQGYFKKSVSDLTLAEGAFLSALPAAPTLYSPFGAHPEGAIARQKEVLQRMVDDGYITQKEADEAKAQELTFAPQINPIKAPHFVMYVKQLLSERYGLRMVEQGGLQITTTLDIKTQDMAEEIVKNEVEKLVAIHVGNGAAVITDPKTGDILAMVGSKNYFDHDAQGNVNVALSLRQPGSSIKVVTYAAALENGFTAASILNDSPVSYTIPGQAVYTPVNYDGQFHGKVPLRYALGNSFNIPAVRTLSQIGMDTMIEKARHMGIGSWKDTSRFGLSLTLGAGEVTMLDMATVYGTLANQGRRVDLWPVLKVTTYQGEILEEKKPTSGFQAVSQAVAFILSDILADNQARTQEFGPNSALVIPGRTVSVKTGTSNDKRDNWTIGYTPSYVVTVWVGNNDGSPMNQVLASGITGAAPIWQQIMLRLTKDKADEKYTTPDTVMALPYFYGKSEYFTKGTEPRTGCPVITPVISSPITPTLKPSR